MASSISPTSTTLDSTRPKCGLQQVGDRVRVRVGSGLVGVRIGAGVRVGVRVGVTAAPARLAPPPTAPLVLAR